MSALTAGHYRPNLAVVDLNFVALTFRVGRHARLRAHQSFHDIKCAEDRAEDSVCEENWRTTRAQGGRFFAVSNTETASRDSEGFIRRT